MAKGLMSLEEVSEYLGWSEEIVEGLINAQKLPGVRMDDNWVFSKSLLDKWIEEFVDNFKGREFKKGVLESENIEVITAIPRPDYSKEEEGKTKKNKN